MRILRYWPFLLFVAWWFACIYDLKRASVLTPHVDGALRYGWLYLAAVFLVAYLLAIYFHTYKKGVMRKFLDRGMSRLKYFSMLIMGILLIPPIFAYGVFEFGAWSLTYTPLAREESFRVLVDTTYPIRRGRVMVKGKDMQGNPVVARIAHGHPRPAEGTIATIECRYAHITCRITNVDTR